MIIHAACLPLFPSINPERHADFVDRPVFCNEIFICLEEMVLPIVGRFDDVPPPLPLLLYTDPFPLDDILDVSINNWKKEHFLFID